MKTKLFIYILAAAVTSAAIDARGFSSRGSGFSGNYSGQGVTAPSGNSGAPPSRSFAPPSGSTVSSGSARTYSAPAAPPRSAPVQNSAPAAPARTAPVSTRTEPVRNTTPRFSGSSGSQPGYTAPAATVRTAPVPAAQVSTRTEPVRTTTPRFSGSSGSQPGYTAPAATVRSAPVSTRTEPVQTTTPRFSGSSGTQTGYTAPAAPGRTTTVTPKPATERITPPAQSARFDSSATAAQPETNARKPVTTSYRPQTSATGKLQSASPGPGTALHSRPALSTRLSTPESRVPGTALSTLPERVAAGQPSDRGSVKFGNSLASPKQPLMSSPRPSGNEVRSERPAAKFSSSNYALQNPRPGTLSGSYSGPSRHSAPPPSYYSRNYNNKHHTYHHSNRHYNNYNYSHYNRYNRCFTPVWCGPVVYPSYYSYGASFGLGFSWSNGSSWLAFGSYSPAYYSYTPYYSSSYYGGYGYSSVYYGGWRSGWYGGLSYACNPWPVYRTYYLYEPEPLIITQPVVIRREVVVQNVSYPEPVISQIQVKPISYTSKYNPDQIVIEERTVIRENGEQSVYTSYTPADADPEYVYDDQYDVFYYAGDDLRAEFTLGFSSYAASLNPESIWVSYAGLDRWQY